MQFNKAQMFLLEFKEFATQFHGKNPQQMVQQLRCEGKMSQEQFNQYRSKSESDFRYTILERWKLK